MIFSDIYIADSGRPIRNTGMVTYVPQVNPATNHTYRVDGINDVIKPSGYGGNVSVHPYASRFDDAGFYESAHSGNFYGNVLRDKRQVYS